MNPLPVTTVAAGVLGLIFAVLSARVTLARVSSGVLLGDGMVAANTLDGRALPVRARVQANFAEYVPMALVLLGLVEWQRGSGPLAEALAASLILARLLHPIGMGIQKPNPYRAAGFALTLIMIVTASVLALAGALS